MAWKGKDNKTALSLSRQTRKTLVAGGSIMGGVVLVANMGQRGPLRASAENGFRTLITDCTLYGNTKRLLENLVCVRAGHGAGKMVLRPALVFVALPVSLSAPLGSTMAQTEAMREDRLGRSLLFCETKSLYVYNV